MTLPFDVPAWLPWWVPLVFLVPCLLWILAFLLVPFSVIGVKSRLDGVEARLDEVHAEVRTLALRLPEGVRTVDFDELYTPPDPGAADRRAPTSSRPPIPPAAHELEARAPRETPSSGSPPGGTRRGEVPGREGRMEPRLDWPR